MKLIFEELIKYLDKMEVFLEKFFQAIGFWISFVSFNHDMALYFFDNLSEFDVTFLPES